MPLVLHGVLGKTFKSNLGSLENHSSSLSCKCYEMPLSYLPLDCCVLVVTVRGMLLEAEPGLPCKTANAVGKQDEGGGGNLLTQITALPHATQDMHL